MKTTLEKRILLFAFVVLTLSISVNTAFNIDGFRRDYRDGLVRRCQSLASGLKLTIENVLALGLHLESLPDINKNCQQIVSTDREINHCFVENTVGVTLFASDSSRYVAEEGRFVRTLDERASLLEMPGGMRVFDVSIPLYGPGGELAGRIRIGFADAILQERISAVFYRSLVILAAAFLLVFSVVALYVRRNLVDPINQLCTVAKEVASGSFQVSVPSASTVEFAELGSALSDMALSLKERDRQVRDSYAELEETNRQLQESYERQEDITAELARSREMYRSLVEYASDAILITDEDDKIIVVNRQAEEFFGMGREEVLGQNLFQVSEQVQCEDIDGMYAAYRNLISGGTMELEIRCRRIHNSEEYIGWLRGSMVRGLDGKYMVQAIVRDVTQERKTQENLEQSARELKRLSRMKDSILGMASHELKTPLTVIVGYSDLLLGEMADQLDESVLVMVRYIAEAGERLSSIVQDMVDMSRLDSKRLQFVNKEVDINQLIKNAADGYRSFFESRGQTLTLALDEGLPHVLCDPDRMTQAIGNLVGNAMKFTPDGGEVFVQTRIRRTLRPPHVMKGQEEARCRRIGTQLYPYVEIIVTDNGIGIAEVDQIRIFDKFYEVGEIEEHSSGKVSFQGKGAGLGLSLAKGIIDMHGGEIWVESAGYDVQNCPGSAFHVLLSIHAVKPAG